MKKISVSIPGGNGRMGKTLIGLIIENEKYNLVSSTCLTGEDEEGWLHINDFFRKHREERACETPTLN